MFQFLNGGGDIAGKRLIYVLCFVGLMQVNGQSRQWSEWSDCEGGCGTIGEETRTRNRINNNKESRTCLVPCENGGIPDGNGCGCLAGTSGDCCQTGSPTGSCGSPTGITNGEVDYGETTPGHVASYTCSEGYILKGDQETFCTTDGTWSGEAPTCQRECLCQNGATCTWFPVGNNYRCTCPAEYTGDFCETALADAYAPWSNWGSWTDCSVPCGSGGTQERARDRCLTIPGQKDECQEDKDERNCNNFCNNGGNLKQGSCSCQFPYTGKCCETYSECPKYSPVIANGHVVKTTQTYGSIIAFRCDENYQLKGDIAQFCTGNQFSDPQWNGSKPECEFSCPCSPWGMCKNIYGQSYECECEPGRTGTNCEQVMSCPTPVDIDNTEIIGSNYEYGAMIAYECAQNHALSLGDRTRTCISKRFGAGVEWNGTEPRCSFTCPCVPGGVCRRFGDDLEFYECNCNLGWTGSNCREVNMVIYMGLIAVTLLILLGFTIISVLYCRKMGKGTKRRRGPREEAPPSYDSLSVSLPTILSTITDISQVQAVGPPPYLADAPHIDADTMATPIYDNNRESSVTVDTIVFESIDTPAEAATIDTPAEAVTMATEIMATELHTIHGEDGRQTQAVYAAVDANPDLNQETSATCYM